ncbi:uncharacterized protein K444DRAFT_386944 [Hyaloscypha bicolor E]|uniref:Uncharacterized protein n=1 Tax=Hyaloscypha bicolor E TaxID=1095630 RepID=A0A2J6TC84_9HELO|nr:uncharacterized protein K444DRAFT_386944 [Hyaloscypha bicolor E]PMD60639.1 hypothetical protein K444DRAFT_386944 [Hyaloscypha bicolor E]
MGIIQDALLASRLASGLIANCHRQPHSRPKMVLKVSMHLYPTSKMRLQQHLPSNQFLLSGRHRGGSVMFMFGIAAHVTRLRLGSWSSIVLTAEPKDARTVAPKRSGCSKALDLPSRKPCGDNTTVRMTSSTVLEWSILVKAVKEVDYSSLPSCLPSRDEG